MVELVATALSREAKLLEVASRLARLPDVVAGSITSYAGGAMGHDPLRVGTAARARGLTPNVHVTCVGQDRQALRKTLEDLHALGIENVFALTGDYPRPGKDGRPLEPPVFDLDSVQLVRLIDELREGGRRFHVAVAVSPFKYVEADCLWQYLKLEKKIAAGADCAITQVGWDAEKFRELKRYLDERGLATPLLGNVYVLGPRAAERMSRGEPPGCWVSPALLEVVRRESQAPDGGLRARLERAARTVAVLRGLGYAGAYIGGTHDADHVAWIIRRAAELAPRWEALAGELAYGGGRRLLPVRARPGAAPGRRRSVPRPARAASSPPSCRRCWTCWAGSSRSPATPGSGARSSALAARVDRRPRAGARGRARGAPVKAPLFGCQSCGNCVLGHLEYVCPQTCPKQMRNGPCGGTTLGRCEVVPEHPCIWVGVYERARDAGRTRDLLTYVPAPDRSLQGTSSWLNYLLDRDRRPREASQDR